MPTSQPNVDIKTALRMLRNAVQLSLLEPVPDLPTKAQVQAQARELGRLVRALSAVADTVSANLRAAIPSVDGIGFDAALMDCWRNTIQPEIESAAETADELHHQEEEEE